MSSLDSAILKLRYITDLWVNLIRLKLPFNRVRHKTMVQIPNVVIKFVNPILLNFCKKKEHINWLLAPFEAQLLVISTSRAPTRAADVEMIRNCPRNKPHLICFNPIGA